MNPTTETLILMALAAKIRQLKEKGFKENDGTKEGILLHKFENVFQTDDDIFITITSIYLTNFPIICHIAKLIAYYNRMINVLESEELYLERVCKIISERSVIEVIMLEKWLAEQTDADLEVIANGEHEEMMALMAKAPNPGFTKVLFDDFFEGE